MYKSKQFLLLLTIAVAFFFSCKKEYSFEQVATDNNLAVFNFIGSPDTCTTAIIKGSYQAGIPFDVTNTVGLSVNVSKAGTYAITTSSVNGVLFSASGKFPATGIQNVMLTGSGIPATAGVFNFTPMVNGCSFPVSVLATVTTDTADIYYEATIDGVHYKQIVTADNGYEAGSLVEGYDDAIPGSNISPSIQPISPNQTQMEIIKGVLHNYQSISNEAFKDFFVPGIYPWAVFGQDGVSLAWTDGTGVNWSTYNIPGTQTESNFTIISTEKAPALTGYYIKVKARFNCKLYDDNGNVKTLTNGTYIGYFGKI